ncbi:unnamed protein product, partial [Symbiodinium necroappetens]
MAVLWTPNMGYHIRVSLATGEPEYDAYKESASWVTCRVLRTVEDDGQVAYPPAGDRILANRTFRRTSHIKKMAVTDLLEGQLAFLQHVHLYEEKHRGTHILQPRLLWKYEFLRCFLGCLPREDLQDLSREIDEIGRTNHSFTSWSVKSSKLLSAVLRRSNN